MMNKREVVEKYNLKRQLTDESGKPYPACEEWYFGTKEKRENDKLLFRKEYIFTNELSCVLSDGGIFFLTVTKYDYTKSANNKPKRTEKMYRVFE